jgi:hypothetical protein
MCRLFSEPVLGLTLDHVNCAPRISSSTIGCSIFYTWVQWNNVAMTNARFFGRQGSASHSDLAFESLQRRPVHFLILSTLVSLGVPLTSTAF